MLKTELQTKHLLHVEPPCVFFAKSVCFCLYTKFVVMLTSFIWHCPSSSYKSIASYIKVDLSHVFLNIKYFFILFQNSIKISQNKTG